jgi:hypothetical protein
MPKDPAAVHVRLPAELNTDLLNAAKANGVTISEEIRNRLKASFEDQPGDLKTRELLAVIADAIEAIDAEFPPWHESPFSHEALRAALPVVIDAYRPQGDPVLKRRPDAVRFHNDTDTAEEVGRGCAMYALYALARRGRGNRST